jgi:RND family efflux transporter MFP subunit
VLVSGTPTTWTPDVRIEGTLSPIEEADIGVKITCRLSSIRARVGDYVHRGQVLATFDGAESAAQLEQAKAQLRSSEASFALAEDMATRTATLTKSGAGSAQADLQAREQRNQVAAQVEAAKAAVNMAQASLANMTLTAPFSGYVTRVPTGTGQVFTFGATLFHMQNTAELKLAGTVGESDVGLVRQGLPIHVMTPGADVIGEVTAVLGSVDSATRRVPIEAKVPNDPKHPLLAGTYVRAEVRGKEELPVLKLPAGALRPGSQDEVMVAEGGHMRARRVVFHPAPDGFIFVRAGLTAKDKVIVDPSPEAKEGDTVTVQP